MEIESRQLLIGFLGFIKMCLTYQEMKEIRDESYEHKPIEFKTILCKSIRLLALLCENCYQPFQVFEISPYFELKFFLIKNPELF